MLVVFLSWGCASRKPFEKANTTPPQETKPPAAQPEIKQETDVKKTVPPAGEENSQKNNNTIDEKEKHAATPPVQEEKKKEDDPFEFLEGAISAYHDARLAWDKGDFETALAALDEAYYLLLQTRLPEDSPLVQEKDDLRLLIAQRIQEIYASRLSTAGGNHQIIPLVENKYVLAEIKRFTTGEKKYFLESYRRSGMYRPFILEELKNAGLPEELSWLPMIESWFKTNAYSRARALGLWQFISSTGYRFGLKRDRYVDERMDFIKASKAAVRYLGELHAMFGDWTTALAGYNSGEFRVQRVIKAQRINYLDNFWDLYLMLPRETARFIPRFIATLLVLNDPEKYGVQLPDPLPPLKFESVIVNKPVKLSSLAQSLGIKASDLEILNPELRHKSTPDSSYQLRVPEGKGQNTLASLAAVQRYVPPEATYVIHYVRMGETVSGIAGRYRTTVGAIARLNRLRRNYLIRPGQRIKVPARGTTRVSSSQPLSLHKQGKNLIYVVKRGDSLYRIANAFNTSVQNIKIRNNLKNDRLSVGQKLVIQSGAPDNAIIYVVRSGDTPYEIAKKYRMNLGTFLSINGMTRRSKIYPGQKVWVNKR
jgi:membrane-bound lytic murein transglycosylase D